MLHPLMPNVCSGSTFEEAISIGRRLGGLYYPNQLHVPSSVQLATPVFPTSPSNFSLWHY